MLTLITSDGINYLAFRDDIIMMMMMFVFCKPQAQMTMTSMTGGTVDGMLEIPVLQP